MHIKRWKWIWVLKTGSDTFSRQMICVFRSTFDRWTDEDRSYGGPYAIVGRRGGARRRLQPTPSRGPVVRRTANRMDGHGYGFGLSDRVGTPIRRHPGPAGLVAWPGGFPVEVKSCLRAVRSGAAVATFACPVRRGRPFWNQSRAWNGGRRPCTDTGTTYIASDVYLLSSHIRLVKTKKKTYLFLYVRHRIMRIYYNIRLPYEKRYPFESYVPVNTENRVEIIELKYKSRIFSSKTYKINLHVQKFVAAFGDFKANLEIRRP